MVEQSCPTIAQEGGVDFPQLQCQVSFEPSEANARRAQLQDLACFAGIAVKFQEAGLAELLVVTLVGGDGYGGDVAGEVD